MTLRHTHTGSLPSDSAARSDAALDIKDVNVEAKNEQHLSIHARLVWSRVDFTRVYSFDDAKVANGKFPVFTVGAGKTAECREYVAIETMTRSRRRRKHASPYRHARHARARKNSGAAHRQRDIYAPYRSCDGARGGSQHGRSATMYRCVAHTTYMMMTQCTKDIIYIGEDVTCIHAAPYIMLNMLNM